MWKYRILHPYRNHAASVVSVMLWELNLWLLQQLQMDGPRSGKARCSQPLKLHGWWIWFHSWTQVSIGALSITSDSTPTHWHTEHRRAPSISSSLPAPLCLCSVTYGQEVAGLKPRVSRPAAGIKSNRIIVMLFIYFFIKVAEVSLIL